MTYEEKIARADVRGALASAAATGTLWAIAISWSNAIRGITLAIVPVDDVIVGEIVAAITTTFLGMILAVTIVRSCATCERMTLVSVRDETPSAPLPHTTFASRGGAHMSGPRGFSG